MKVEDSTQTYIELQPGTILCGGKYVIQNKIGEGGFGITYKALQNGLNRTVCIKEYFPAGRCGRATHARTVYVQGMNDNLFEKYRQAFVKEAKMLATLRHQNVVEVIDVFDENNTSYMVMSFIDGESLQSIVESRGRISYPEAVNYIAQITNAVGYIHNNHILHRDIKPDNIMITADYKAILIDFGSAREFEQDKTQVHTSMLTHGYAPTEQYTANSRKGSYTDIYAIGATMYFMLTGQVPLEAAARLTETMVAPKEIVPDLPDEVNRTILKAMQLKAENRHQTIQEFMDDLRNVKPSVLVDETVGGGNKSYKRYWVLLVIVCCIVAILTGTITILLDRPTDSNTDEAQYETFDFTGMDCYPMIKVCGGAFVMGSDTSEEDDCTPHKVVVRDFYIGQFEVTQSFWEKIMGEDPTAYQLYKHRDSLPVANVSFEEIQLFIDRLNAKTGRSFSLPTEAQWEYAARGGSKSNATHFAGSKYPSAIWYNKKGPFRVRFNSSVNELGLYHMSGNVAEWCMDYYDADFYESSINNIDPINDVGGRYRVIRGGSFKDNDARNVTVYYRDADNKARPYVGFRLVMN